MPCCEPVHVRERTRGTERLVAIAKLCAPNEAHTAVAGDSCGSQSGACGSDAGSGLLRAGCSRPKSGTHGQ
eukprot:2148550-Prymnesium_polylepis.1